MNTRRRLALVMVALPLAFYGYACSSDDATDNPAGGDGGNETGTNPGNDSSTGNDTSTGTDSSTTPDAADAGDANDGAVLPTCIGNPLTADGGGSVDGGVNLDAGVVTQIVTALNGDFLDGPQWLDADGGGFLVYSEYNVATPQILRVAADGGGNVAFRTSGFTGGMNGPVGNALRNGVLITAVDALNATGTPTLFLSTADGGDAGFIGLGDSGSTSPNDLVVGPNNNLYFTDGQYQNAGHPGTAGLYRIADGGVTAVQQNFGRANGIAISRDLTTLYVGIGPQSGDPDDPKAILQYPVSATGAVGTAASFLTAADLVDVPDGIAVDVGGNLWVAEAVAGGGSGGRVEVFSPAKKKLGTIPFPSNAALPQRPTGVAFGGADGKTLFITTETGVFTYVSRCAGVR